MPLRCLLIAVAVLTCLPALCADRPEANPTTAITIDQLEEGVAWLINAERTNAGLPTLEANGDLGGAARAHCDSMKKEGYLGSQAPDGSGPEQRYASAGAASVFESIIRLEALGLTAASPTRVHYTLMTDDTYRDDLLSEEVNSVGVGCAADEGGTIWATVVFAALPEAPAAGTSGSAGTPAGAASAAGATAAPAVSVIRGVTGPVRTYLWRAEAGPANGLTASAPVGVGEYVRAVVSVPAGASIQATAYCPDAPEVALRLVRSAELSSLAFDRLVAWPTRPLSGSGRYVLQVDSAQPVPCRVSLVAGSPLAVLAYGAVCRAPAPLGWNATVYGSVGDGGGAETYAVQIGPGQIGTLTVSPLAPGFAATVALFSPDDREIGRWQPEQIGTGLGIPLAALPPGVYTLTLTDPAAGPDGDDFQLHLE